MRPGKPYKAVDPKVTINKIRNILNENGIFLIETYFNKYYDFFSHRSIICSNELTKLNKGVNGKGLTPEYSLASAYGEFMEYIQNYHFFDDILEYTNKEYIHNQKESEFSKTILSNNLALDFSYDPDEKYLSYNELNQNPKKIFDHIATFIEEAYLATNVNANKKLLFAPYYCVNEGFSEYLPLSLIRSQSGSNGLCAGNTKEEAILHGICEIFERYVAKRIFIDEITPPTIPTETFHGTKIYDLLSKIEKEKNISVIIKDCSLNQGLPVIGLLIIDHDSHSYAFKLGSDISPVIALERCFTELFQGHNQLRETLKRIDLANDPFEHSSISRDICKKMEFYLFIRDGSGKIPNSMFSPDSSYSFSGLNQDLNKSDKEDLKYLLGLIEKLGFRTYLRDVSFLNFPSFDIYIPGMSEVLNTFKSENEKDHFKWDGKNYFSLLFNLKNNTIEEFIQVAEMIEEYPYPTITLFPYNVSKDNFINKYYLLTLIYYRISNYSKSYENLKKMIDSFTDREIRRNTYLLCARDYIFFKSKGHTKDEIVALLKNIYIIELISDVSKDLDDEADIFHYQSFPACFNCEKCEIRKDCHYLDTLGFIKNIQEKHKTNRINQNSLEWLSELTYSSPAKAYNTLENSDTD